MTKCEADYAVVAQSKPIGQSGDWAPKADQRTADILDECILADCAEQAEAEVDLPDAGLSGGRPMNWRLNFGNGQIEQHPSRASAVRSYNGDQQYRSFFRVERYAGDGEWVAVTLTRDETER